MRVVWAGLILFVVMTVLAAAAFNFVHFATRPANEGGLVIFKDDVIAAGNTVLVALATFPSVLLMMLIWSLRGWRGPMVGVASILTAVLALALWAYLDMALSPYEPKRAAQWGAVWWFLGGLAYIVPAYLLSYALLRRLRVMAPLLGAPTPAKSTALP